MRRYLLRVEVQRLDTALRIEEERSIVFPETTMIVRDVVKLIDSIWPPGAGVAATVEDEVQAVTDPELASLLDDLKGDD